MELVRKSPTFGLYFRRYVPSASLGDGNAVAPKQRFRRDQRSGASTSLHATARTYACVMFNRDGIVRQFAGTNGTSIHLKTWGEVLAFSKISFAVIRGNLAGPSLFEFTASTKGFNPLAPKAADIETTVTFRVDFGHAGSLLVDGEAFGDNIPNLEVFLVCERSTHTALLIDGRAEAGRTFGPGVRLRDAHLDHSLGVFSAILPLSGEGELAADYAVKPTALRAYGPGVDNSVKGQGGGS